jgi:3-oxoacyl-[acyl-carrier protein] reductase
MDLDLSGKRAVVCGSTQGIGKASAIELALLGASITLVARNETALKQALTELPTKANQKHDYLIADFSDVKQVEEIIQEYAKSNVSHILINNTGGPPAGLAIDANTAEFVSAFSNHLLCNHVITQALVPNMKQEGYGRIINIISTSVKIPIAGLGVSNTIRGAVANWAKTLSNELAPYGITVNNVLPGSTLTGRIEFVIKSRAQKTGKPEEVIRKEMIDEIPAGRMADASEVAAAVAFLATPAAAYINGINLPVDGGRTGSL